METTIKGLGCGEDLFGGGFGGLREFRAKVGVRFRRFRRRGFRVLRG